MYATLADLINALGNDRLLAIADRDDDDQVDTAVVDQALADASAEIDAAVGGRYQLPIGPVPVMLRRICVDIAHYHLDLNPSDDQESRVKHARASLTKISKGEMTLTDAALVQSGEDPSEGGQSANEAAVKSFQSGLDMGGFN